MEIRIIHILKNGREVKNISGHIIKKTDVPEIYQLVKGEIKWTKKN